MEIKIQDEITLRGLNTESYRTAQCEIILLHKKKINDRHSI